MAPFDPFDPLGLNTFSLAVASGIDTTGGEKAGRGMLVTELVTAAAVVLVALVATATAVRSRGTR